MDAQSFISKVQHVLNDVCHSTYWQCINDDQTTFIRNVQTLLDYIRSTRTPRNYELRAGTPSVFNPIIFLSIPDDGIAIYSCETQPYLFLNTYERLDAPDVAQLVMEWAPKIDNL